MDETLAKLTRKELRYIVYEQLGIRPSNRLTTAELHDLLSYKITEKQVEQNDVNFCRDTIMAFIKRHREQLSIPCNANCYEHSDAIVISCWRQLNEDTDGNVND